MNILTLRVVLIAAAVLLSMTACSGPQNPAVLKAWQDFRGAVVQGDCAKFDAITTAQYRSDQGIVDCGSFAKFASTFQSLTHWQVDITSITVKGDAALLATHELIDEANGKHLDLNKTYNFSSVDGGKSWLVDQWLGYGQL